MARRSVWLASGALLLLLGGCGKGGEAKNGTAEAPGASVALGSDGADVVIDQGEGMTAIDAATGDAAGMPKEWRGPTAYDLRDRVDPAKERNKEKADRNSDNEKDEPAKSNGDPPLPSIAE